jgi:hypothetical protein
VNAANAQHAHHTHSRRWASLTAVVACLVAFGALISQAARTGPAKLWAPAAMVGLAVSIEGAFRLTEREIRLRE